MNPAHIRSVFAARNREFMRDRSTLAWNIAFPVLVVVGFAILFSGDNVDLYKVGVYGDSQGQPFFETDYIRFIPVEDLDDAIPKVERHRLDMLLDSQTRRYWINDTSPRGYILERVLWGTQTDQRSTRRETVSGDEVRYVDWVVPGVLGMNMMFSALFGVGYVIVRYRKSGVLRRLKATPLQPLEFLLAQVLSRLWLILAITVFVFAGTHLLLDFSMFGSYWNLLLIAVLGAMSLISMGLALAARTASQELAGGLLNLLSWPMMFLSEVWFSLEGAPVWVQKLALIFPLTHLVDGARSVMIDGAGFTDIAGQLLALAAMTAVFLSAGALLFRWE